MLGLDEPLLLGRERELAAIEEYVRRPRSHRVLVLSGPVGSGRTSLIRAALTRFPDYHRIHLDASPAAKPFGLAGVEERLDCFGRESSCIDQVVQESMEAADHRPDAKILIAVDGLTCIRSGDRCLIHHIVRGLARFVEAYSDRVRVIISLDDQEAALELGRVSEYIELLVVEGLPREHASQLVRREASKAGIRIPEDRVDEIVTATGGLPYHILTIVYEYRGDLNKWLADIWEKVRWKLALVASDLGISAKDAANAILDLVDKPLSSVPRQSYMLLRSALRNNLVYLARGGVVRFQLPAYAGAVRSVAYGC